MSYYVLHHVQPLSLTLFFYDFVLRVMREQI